MEEENKKIVNFEGFMKLSGNDGTQRVYFDSEDEEDMIEAGFFYFVVKDFKDTTEYLLVNPNEGIIRSIKYHKE